jgi:hypothetical protein
MKHAIWTMEFERVERFNVRVLEQRDVAEFWAATESLSRPQRAWPWERGL